jgi:uncharacterized membrane-anchored protein
MTDERSRLNNLLAKCKVLKTSNYSKRLTTTNRSCVKVPQVTIFFWIIKVLCTTVGETFADYLNTTLGFGLNGTTTFTVAAFQGL